MSAFGISCQETKRSSFHVLATTLSRVVPVTTGYRVVLINQAVSVLPF